MTSLAITGPTMTGFADEGRKELQRWLICATVAVTAHVGFAAAMLYSHDVDDADIPSAGIVIDLAPMPLMPIDTPIVPMAVPQGPEQYASEATPDQPAEKTEEKVEEIVRAIDPDVALVAEPLKADTPAEAQPETTAPQLPKLVNSTAIPTWKRQISLILERNKRYPHAAQSRNEAGVVELAFTLDRQGRVTASRIVKTSGSTALDNETLELVKRAQPFPPPPAEMSADQLNLIVPVRFNFK
jgi:periplasmic protein TonB